MSLMPKKKKSFSDAAKSLEKKMLLKNIAETTDLPTPNANMMKLVRLLRDDEVELQKLVILINKDQALVAKILKLINSGYYGIRKTIDSVERAINLLGLLKIRQLVYSASVMDMFGATEQNEWEHAYSSSVLMSNIMQDNQLPASSNLPLTTLMHDIGKIALRKFAPKKYKMVKLLAEEEQIPLHEAETRLLQLNHAEAGAYLLKSWGMEENIWVPVREHHINTLMPREYTLEITLLQIVNWVDSKARDLPCPVFPHQEVINSIGLEPIDKLQWVNYQHKLLESINSEKE